MERKRAQSGEGRLLGVTSAMDLAIASTRFQTRSRVDHTSLKGAG